jgi:hypothetical protein
MSSNTWLSFSAKIKSASETILESRPLHPCRTLVVVWLVGLYGLGIVGFGQFFAWGNFDMQYMDWSNITGPRLQFLRSAVLEGQFPLQISDTATLQSATNRYLAVPDVIISPQIILLYKLPLPWFSLVDIWLLYSAGFGGLLVLRRKLGLSLLSFSALFLLFNFNGSILAHFSAGHITWGGYFLFPWFIWLVFRLIEGDKSWSWTWLMALLLFVIWLQGSYHQFVYLLILLAAVGIFVPSTFWTVIRTGVFTFIVSAFRLLPAILVATQYRQSFLNGYPSLFSILDNLVNLPSATSTSFSNPYVGLGQSIGEWEVTAFVGLVGALFLIYFGIYRGLLKGSSPFRTLLFPLGVLLLLCFGPVFQIFQSLPIPLIQGERVAARLFEVVLAFSIVLAAERFQCWLDTSIPKPLTLAGGLLALGLIGADLWQDLTYWSVTNRPLVWWNYFNPANWFVKNDLTDTLYLWLVFGGLAISMTSILVLGWLSWREHPQFHPGIAKWLALVLHVLAGWGILAAIIIIGRNIFGVSTAMVLQAVVAPFLYALISWSYFRRFSFTNPVQTAAIFTGVVILLNALVFAFFTPQGVTIYFRPLSAWLAFALIFAVTYFVGIWLKNKQIQNQPPESKGF